MSVEGGDTRVVRSVLQAAVVIVDVDGVVSAVHPEAPAWGGARLGESETLCAE